MRPIANRCVRRILAAKLSALLLVAASTLAGCTTTPSPRGITWTGQPVGASAAASQECADLLFVGVRGSGEPAPYGDTVAAVRDELARRSTLSPTGAQLNVREVFLDYPAVSPETLGEVGADRLLFEPTMPATKFFDSVRTGREQLVGLLTDSARRCPDERWVLSGFSQGAQVVTESLTDERVPINDDRLLGAIMLGNPANSGNSEGIHRVGDASPDSMGLSTSLYYIRYLVSQNRKQNDELGISGAVRGVVELSRGPLDASITDRVSAEQGFTIPESIRGRVTQVCESGDLICNAGPGLGRIVFSQNPLQAEVDRAQPIHLGYARLLAPTVASTSEAIAGWAWGAPVSTDRASPSLALLGVAAATGVALLVAVAIGWRVRSRPRSGDHHATPQAETPEPRGETPNTQRDS